MKQVFFILLFTIFSCELYAEKIDGPANIRRSPEGEQFISLFDKTEVTCTEIDNNWYQVGFVVKITKEQYDQNEITIPRGTKLYSLQNKLIGESLAELTFVSKMSGGRAKNTWYATEFVGYTYKSNILPESIPENGLRDILIQHKNELQFIQFEPYIKQFDFDEVEFLDLESGYKEYMIYENWIDDPSPMDRIRLLFKKNNLVAIIHTRDLGVDYLDQIDLIRGRNISIIENMSIEERDDFVKINREIYYIID